MTELTKADLVVIHTSLARLRPPRGPDPSVEELVAINGVLAKVTTMIETARTVTERGRRILCWRLNTEVAPTMNEIGQWHQRQPWRPKKTRELLEGEIARMIAETPDLDLAGAQLPRWVRVTRFTTQPKKVDDSAVDQIGGKLPVDMLKKAGVFVDDSPRWLSREAHVLKTSMGNTHVLVEVFELAEYAVHTAPPEDGPAPPELTKRRKVLNEDVAGGDVAISKRGRARVAAREKRAEKRSGGLTLVAPPAIDKGPIG